MGKSTISMALFNRFLYVYQRVVIASQLLGAKPLASVGPGHGAARCLAEFIGTPTTLW